MEMVPANLIEPYEISNTIRNAIGEDNAILRARPGRLLRKQPEQEDKDKKNKLF